MDAIIYAVSQIGFPIVVAMFVLYRMNGKLERLASAMEKLCERSEFIIDHGCKYEANR